jgi:hypothetical protein
MHLTLQGKLGVKISDKNQKNITRGQGGQKRAKKV